MEPFYLSEQFCYCYKTHHYVMKVISVSEQRGLDVPGKECPVVSQDGVSLLLQLLLELLAALVRIEGIPLPQLKPLRFALYTSASISIIPRELSGSRRRIERVFTGRWSEKVWEVPGHCKFHVFLDLRGKVLGSKDGIQTSVVPKKNLQLRSMYIFFKFFFKNLAFF